MSKTKKTNHVKDMNVIESGNMEQIREAIINFAFDQETQNLLVKNPEMLPILDLYTSIRRICKQTVAMLLTTKKGKYSLEVIRKAVIGNFLDERNEEALITSYPELVEEYLQNKKDEEGNPCCFFSSRAVEEVAKEAGLSKLIRRYPRPRFYKECTQSLGGLFTPEMLARLELKKA